MTYNGHRNRNAWNVSLWLFNDEGFYRLMCAAVERVRFKGRTLDDAAEGILSNLPPRTPDGVPFTKTNVRLALRGWEAVQ